MSEEAARRFRAEQPDLRLAKLVYFRIAVQERILPAATTSTAGPSLAFEAVSTADGNGLAGATVVAFTDFTARRGAMGRTDQHGRVRLQFGSAVSDLERVYVYPPAGGFWGAYRHNLVPSGTIRIGLEPVDLTVPDVLRHFYGASSFAAAAGVRVGVVDTGISPHPDLAVSGGRNTVTGEPAGDFSDPQGHGTHCAGIIAANGALPAGLRGVAPGVDLRAYRVFGANSDGASNYAIAKAMILAAADGCDILSLSLGGDEPDEVTREAVTDARNQGIVVIAAAGNDGRRPVSFPAAYADSVAVSAFGRDATFPSGSIEEADVDVPRGTPDTANFMASFTNKGSEVDLTAPGVGVVSTLPGGAHGPMSGTSMATPAAAGAAACVLSQDAPVMAQPRDRKRSDAIVRLLYRSAQTLGFPMDFEGMGQPRC
jgi:subtilisin